VAEIGEDKLGTKGEYDLRDDDRADDTPYRRGHSRGLAPLFIIGLVVAGAFLLYGALHRSEPGVELRSPVVQGTR
jgi:hypothetical protein